MIVDMTTIDTTPGAGGAMAPSEDSYDMGPEAYRNLIRHRYQNNPMYRQHMRVWARRLAETKITGPHAADARWILEQIG